MSRGPSREILRLKEASASLTPCLHIVLCTKKAAGTMNKRSKVSISGERTSGRLDTPVVDFHVKLRKKLNVLSSPYLNF